jgi:hypothetical protein
MIATWRAVLAALLPSAGSGDFLDVPSVNRNAIALAKLRLAPVFRLLAVYSRTRRADGASSGVTTLELG